MVFNYLNGPGFIQANLVVVFCHSVANYIIEWHFYYVNPELFGCLCILIWFTEIPVLWKVFRVEI